MKLWEECVTKRGWERKMEREDKHSKMTEKEQETKGGSGVQLWELYQLVRGLKVQAGLLNKTAVTPNEWFTQTRTRFLMRTNMLSQSHQCHILQTLTARSRTREEVFVIIRLISRTLLVHRPWFAPLCLKMQKKKNNVRGATGFGVSIRYKPMYQSHQLID